MADRQPTITRTYKGTTGSNQYREDAAVMAKNGYSLASEIREPGGRSGAANGFIATGIISIIAGVYFPPLWVFAIVCLVIGVLSGKQKDTVTVIWRIDAKTAPVQTDAPAPASEHLATLASLAQLRDSGAISAEEYEAKKAELLERV